MSSPLITVVIPAYNRGKLISQAIQSVLSQRTTVPWKLLIIDDGSTDDTVQKIRSFLPDERIQFIQLKENRGISQVLNTALEHIDTPYFVQLDSDDCLTRDALEELSKAIDQADPNTALFYGNMYILRQTKRGAKVVRYFRHREFKDKYDFLKYLTYMLHPRMYRTEAVREVGGWDTDDPFQGRVMEDRRICLKLIERYPAYWIDKPLYFLRKHKSQLTNRKNISKRNYLRKKIIQHYLKKWGDKYRPVFTYRHGLLVIKKLVKKKKGRRNE